MKNYVAVYRKYRFRHHYRTGKSEDELLEEYDNLLEENKKTTSKKD